MTLETTTTQPPGRPMIELVFFAGCPHVDAARERLREALRDAGSGATWVEWDVHLPSTPARYRDHPSPAILIDGRDVLGDADPAGPCCRVDGAPPVATILEALGRLTG